jgi:pimeloyl-ACP methyl ester carboxylesterase
VLLERHTARCRHVRRDVRAAIGRAQGIGADDWTPRHSFVSLPSDSGVPVDAISRPVGHKGKVVMEVQAGRTGGGRGAPILRNPANRGRAVALTYDQFRYSWANNRSEEEAHSLYEKFHAPAPGAPLFQAVLANVNPTTEAKVDTKNPDRGPLLFISGEKDRMIPRAIVESSYSSNSRTRASRRSSRFPVGSLPDHRLGVAGGARPALEFLSKHR